MIFHYPAPLMCLFLLVFQVSYLIEVQPTTLPFMFKQVLLHELHSYWSQFDLLCIWHLGLWLWILLKWRMHVFYILALQMSQSNFVTKRLNTFKWLALIYRGVRLKKVKGKVKHIPVLFMILIAFISWYSCCSLAL